MLVKQIITPDTIVCGADISSKKRALELASEVLSKNQSDYSAQDIFESFIMREKLGSTALGHGVALPHGRLKQTLETKGALLLLNDGVDFDADDKIPVDIIFAMLVPEQSTEEHLKLLAQLAEMFSNEEFRTTLRKTTDNKSLYDLITNWQPQ
jgi:PTS system nitrogen regulatory IIA component